VGANGATETSAAFTFRNNVVAMDDLTIEGAGFLMTGKGWLSPADDRLAFSMRVQARGAPGGTTPLPGSLQAYVAEGKFSEPLWVLKAEE
jgi:hypothetical protein